MDLKPKFTEVSVHRNIWVFFYVIALYNWCDGFSSSVDDKMDGAIAVAGCESCLRLPNWLYKKNWQANLFFLLNFAGLNACTFRMLYALPPSTKVE